MQEISKYIGKKIRDIREEKGVTQKELGELLSYSPMGISHFENGIRDLRLSDIKKLAEYFKVDLSYFLPEGSNPVPEPTFFRADASNDPHVEKSLDDFDAYLNKLQK